MPECPPAGMLLGVTLTVGARAYPARQSESRWLAVELETRSRPSADACSRAGAQVAKAIQVALEDESLEPLVLGRSQIGSVCDVLHDSHLEQSPRLSALDEALWRYQGEPELGP